eukprot:6201949-Pyramimonas_sp.AAC.1
MLRTILRAGAGPPSSNDRGQVLSETVQASPRNLRSAYAVPVAPPGAPALPDLHVPRPALQ